MSNTGERRAKMPAVRTVVAIVNQKGGVGKSTTAINLAAYLAGKGEKILVVDMDPQGNATSGLGVSPGTEGCMYDVLLEGKPLQDVAVQTEIEGLDVAPATINLVGETAASQVESDGFVKTINNVFGFRRQTTMPIQPGPSPLPAAGLFRSTHYKNYNTPVMPRSMPTRR